MKAPFPHVYGEIHTTRYFALGKLRESLSVECSRATDEAYVQVLAEVDDDIAAAQRLLLRASERIFDHVRDRALT